MSRNTGTLPNRYIAPTKTRIRFSGFEFNSVLVIFLWRLLYKKLLEIVLDNLGLVRIYKFFIAAVEKNYTGFIINKI